MNYMSLFHSKNVYFLFKCVKKVQKLLQRTILFYNDGSRMLLYCKWPDNYVISQKETKVRVVSVYYPLQLLMGINVCESDTSTG